MADKKSRKNKRKLLGVIWGNKCGICGGFIKGEKATVDHIIPKSRGGSSRIENLQFAHRKCNEEKKAKYLQNFYRHLIIRNGCWGYKKFKDTNGYVRIEIGQRKIGLLHRISWELHNGTIPEGMQVNHKCHNPQCCRPSHLYLGTQKDNIRDQIDRGTFVKGSKHGMSILDENEVKEIKSMLRKGKMKHREIAEIFNVNRSTITDIRREKTWKHVQV